MNQQLWRAALLFIVLLGTAIALSYTAFPVLYPEKKFPVLPQCIRCGSTP